MKKKPLVQRAYEAGRKAAKRVNPLGYYLPWSALPKASQVGFLTTVKYVKAHPNDK